MVSYKKRFLISRIMTIYIRKAAYISLGENFIEDEELQSKIIFVLNQLFNDELAHVRQNGCKHSRRREN